MAQNTPQDWYYSLPTVTRNYLTVAVLTTCATSFGMLSPMSLYFDSEKIFYGFEIWRFITCFIFFGKFSFPFVFQLYILVKYSSILEPNPYPSGGGAHMGNVADYIFMLVFGGLLLCFFGWLLVIPFLGSSLVFMILYVWSRRNPETIMGIMGFKFQGFYLPWVMLAFGVLIGNSPVFDLLGIAAGHLYYFLAEVLPGSQGFMGGTRLMYTPQFLNDWCGTAPSNLRPQDYMQGRAAGAMPMPGPVRHDWGGGNVLGGNAGNGGGRPHQE